MSVDGRIEALEEVWKDRLEYTLKAMDDIRRKWLRNRVFEAFELFHLLYEDLHAVLKGILKGMEEEK